MAKKNVTQLPIDKHKLEAVIASRFVDSMQERHFSELNQNKENDLDFTCIETINGEIIKWEIELTEFFIKDWRMIDISRQDYFEELTKVFGNEEWIQQHSIQISDGHTPFPNIKKEEGQKLLKAIINTIKSLKEHYKDTKNGILRAIELDHNCSIHFIKNSQKITGFRFYGGYPGSETGFSEIITETIEKKINKNYNRPEASKRMLLCYSTQNWFQFDTMLKSYIQGKNNNQFDEIWYTHPLPLEDPSSNTRII